MRLLEWKNLTSVLLLLGLLLLTAVKSVAQLPTAEALTGSSEQVADSFRTTSTKFFSVDNTLFRYDQNHVLLEAYTLVDRSFLATEPVGEGVQARYRITFKIYVGDSLLTGDTWVRKDYSSDPSARAFGQRIPELMNYVVLPGDYRVEVTVADLIRRVFRSEKMEIKAVCFPGEGLSISGIILASRIEKTDDDAGEFNHNGLLVLPNAERIFGNNVPKVYFYTEIYNLTESEDALYTVRREVLNQDGMVAEELNTSTRSVAASDVVDHGDFSVADLPTGSYVLRLTVTDEATGDNAVAERNFWVYRPGEEVVRPMLINPGFDIAAMSDEEVTRELKVVRYLMSKRVQSAVKRLDPDGKRAFLAKFWVANDPNPETKVNEFRTEYLRRVKEADERFGTFNREGWSTDRGRIYCLYSEPTDIEYHPFDVNAGRSYQIWRYDSVEGGVIFVFVDRNNYGDYILVHSTKNGETYNPSWRSTEVMR